MLCSVREAVRQRGSEAARARSDRSVHRKLYFHSASLNGLFVASELGANLRHTPHIGTYLFFVLTIYVLTNTFLL